MSDPFTPEQKQVLIELTTACRPPPFSWTSPMRQDASGKHVEETQAS
jgi:hypothetical protein